MDYRLRDALFDGAITGDYCAHFWYDPDAMPYGGAFGAHRGEIQMELVDGINVMFGNPNDRRVETQPYILIVGRDTVEHLRWEAERFQKNKKLYKSGKANTSKPDMMESEFQPDQENQDFTGVGGRTEIISDDLSFSVESGSFHCIIGVSGCGKSTIFRMTNGLLQPKSGTIRVGGKPIGEQKHYCGYMPQKDLLFPWRTIGENLALPLEIRGGLSKAERRERVDDALADVGLEGCRDKMPDELSGGMRQRAAFARTMLTGSDLLLPVYAAPD